MADNNGGGAVELGAGGATVIDTPEGLEWYGRRSTLAQLTIECRTGMRHSRGSVMQVANAHAADMLDADAVRRHTRVVLPNPWGHKRTKVGALADLALAMLVTYGSANGAIPATTRGALGETLAASIERKAARITAALVAMAAAEAGTESGRA